MNITERFGRSLRARLFIATGGIVLVAVLAAVGFTALRSHQVADTWVRQALTSARDAQSRTQLQRLSRLRLVSRFVAGDPNFVAYVAEGDPASVRDLLLERQHELESDLAAVLDTRGRVVARTDTPAGVGADLSHDPVVAAAMENRLADGLWSDGQHYWTVVAEPLVSGRDLAVGVLVTGLALDDALAEDVHRQSRADVAYVALDGTPRVIASTIGDREDLREALVRRLGRGGSPPSAPVRLAVGGHSWIVDVAPLRSAAAGPRVAMATLASEDEALAPFLRIREALVLVGLLSLIVAGALSYALAARVTRPVARLAAAADAARQGSLDGAAFSELDAKGGTEEVTRLARAFRGLLRDLRAERENQATLQTLWARLPDPEAGPRAETPLHSGMVIGGRFEIRSSIGTGGAGIVYRAIDRELGEAVALKTLHPGSVDAAALEAFKAELRIARLITHPNVLRTHDFGVADGMAFISMELVRGETLRVVLEHLGALPVSMSVSLARQMLHGLEAAHGLGVLHRDIKPENLILDTAGRLRIMDFGIARLVRADAQRQQHGTFGYLAPEILRGETGDARADQYAVGVVLYEMLTGRRPFTAASVDELVYRMINEPPPSPRAVDARIPEPLERIVLRCLAADPSARFASVAELAQAVDGVEV
jgi:HAMP domain-containing protein